jgi:hypothetical protein
MNINFKKEGFNITMRLLYKNHICELRSLKTFLLHIYELKPSIMPMILCELKYPFDKKLLRTPTTIE